MRRYLIPLATGLLASHALGYLAAKHRVEKKGPLAEKYHRREIVESGIPLMLLHDALFGLGEWAANRNNNKRGY